MEDLKNPF